MQKNNSQSYGFSLVELLVVVAIIGILSAVAIPAYFNHINRTRQANGVQQLLDIKTAQEKFYALNDRYATSMAVGSTLASLVSFNVADTRYYTYSVASTNATTFTAQINGKNGTGLQGDRWQITQAWADPQQLGTPAGFSFSVLADLFH